MGSGRHPPDGPPTRTALNALPSGTPPPISKTTSLRVVPIGTSINPGLFTLPVREKHFVPVHFGVPVLENHAPPFWTIKGMLARVSTFCISVGFPHKPEFAGYGGRGRGIALRPSTDASMAVSSPAQNPPAPNLSSRSNLKGVSITFPPMSDIAF